MYICLYYTYICTYMYAYIHTHTQWLHECVCIPTHILVYIHINTLYGTHPPLCTHIYTHSLNVFPCVYLDYTCIMFTYTDAYTHTHTLSPNVFSCVSIYIHTYIHTLSLNAYMRASHTFRVYHDCIHMYLYKYMHTQITNRRAKYAIQDDLVIRRIYY